MAYDLRLTPLELDQLVEAIEDARAKYQKMAFSPEASISECEHFKRKLRLVNRILAEAKFAKMLNSEEGEL